jgi:hypothetical protein
MGHGLVYGIDLPEGQNMYSLWVLNRGRAVAAAWRGALGLLLAMATALASAQVAPRHIGVVKSVSGEATVVTLGQETRAVVGTPVFQGSTIRTAAGASLGLTFQDNTMMSFGPRTELVVDEYLYAPSQGQLKIASRMSRGTLNYVSGVISKLKPDAVTVTTPTGLIGMRGTHALVQVDE